MRQKWRRCPVGPARPARRIAGPLLDSSSLHLAPPFHKFSNRSIQKDITSPPLLYIFTMSITVETNAAAPAPEAEQPTTATEAPKQVEETTTTTAEPAAEAPANDAAVDTKVRESLACRSRYLIGLE